MKTITADSFTSLLALLRLNLPTLQVSGFGSGGICVNNCHNFFDFLIETPDKLETFNKLISVLSPFGRKIEVRDFSQGYLRLWVYWGKPQLQKPSFVLCQRGQITRTFSVKEGTKTLVELL